MGVCVGWGWCGVSCSVLGAVNALQETAKLKHSVRHPVPGCACGSFSGLAGQSPSLATLTLSMWEEGVLHQAAFTDEVFGTLPLGGIPLVFLGGEQLASSHFGKGPPGARELLLLLLVVPACAQLSTWPVLHGLRPSCHSCILLHPSGGREAQRQSTKSREVLLHRSWLSDGFSGRDSGTRTCRCRHQALQGSPKVSLTQF